HRRSSRLPPARSLTIRFGQLAEGPKAPRCRRGIPLGSPRFESLTAHQCSGGATGRRVRSRTALLRVRISPRTPQARSHTRQRQLAQTVSSAGSNPAEPTNAPVVQPVEATASKAVECWLDRKSVVKVK